MDHRLCARVAATKTIDAASNSGEVYTPGINFRSKIEWAMWSNPFVSMTAANTYDIGRIAHRPFQTKTDTPTNAITAKISNDSQISKEKIGSIIKGCRSRIA